MDVDIDVAFCAVVEDGVVVPFDNDGVDATEDVDDLLFLRGDPVLDLAGEFNEWKLVLVSDELGDD